MDSVIIYPGRNLRIDDEVRIHNRNWYDRFRGPAGYVTSPGEGINTLFTPMHARMCGQEVKITSIRDNGYTVSGSELLWQEWMFAYIYARLDKKRDWYPVFLITGHFFRGRY